jgi:2-polyprenyl-3-methyl-5-hydroxy-6-metoxy-1,4-benzoquinol methylase
MGEEHRLRPAPMVEANEAVWKHSKTKLFLYGLRIIERLAPRKGELLDIGCGFGYFADIARKKGWTVAGIEIEPKAVAFARDHYRLPIFDKPARETAIPDSRYDAITLWSVIEQFPDPVGEIREMYRILKPGGIIFIRSYNFAFHNALMKMTRALTFFPLGMRPIIFHAYNFTPQSIRKDLLDAGFSSVSVISSPATSGDPYNTGGVAGKYLVGATKLILYFISIFVDKISRGSLITSSSLIAVARKPQ